VIIEVIRIRFNIKYVTVMAASYAAIVGRNSKKSVLCRVNVGNLGKEESGFFPGLLFYCQSPRAVLTPRLRQIDDASPPSLHLFTAACGAKSSSERTTDNSRDNNFQ
jgi:hypothetical protein